MRQPAIPKLSELSTVGRAELLAIWTATFDQPPTALRSSRELLASALAWQLQERKFGGLSGATKRKLRVLARAQERKKRSSQLPGVSEVLRSDNLSAATHDLRRSRGRALTRRYRDLLDHYGLRASLIQVGEAHENGVVEQAHRRTKSMLAQALMLRGSHDFISVEDYQHWLRAVVDREHNSKLGAGLAEERRHLRELPAAPIPAYTTLAARVRRWSTIQVLGDLFVAVAAYRRTRHRAALC